MEYIHWRRADTSLEDLATRRTRLVPLPAVAEEESRTTPDQVRNPLGGIRDERFQEHSLRYAAHPNLTALKAELAWQAHGLAASIAEQLGDSGIRHERFFSVNSIYHK